LPRLVVIDLVLANTVTSLLNLTFHLCEKLIDLNDDDLLIIKLILKGHKRLLFSPLPNDFLCWSWILQWSWPPKRPSALPDVLSGRSPPTWRRARPCWPWETFWSSSFCPSLRKSHRDQPWWSIRSIESETRDLRY